MAVTVQFFDSYVLNLGRKVFDMLSDTWKISLHDGYVFNASHTQFSQITGELSGLNGYVAGGNPLSAVTWALGTPTSNTEWKAANPTWTASGGNLGGAAASFTGSLIYSDTATNDEVVLYYDHGGSNSVLDGQQLTIAFTGGTILTGSASQV